MNGTVWRARVINIIFYCLSFLVSISFVDSHFSQKQQGSAFVLQT